MTKRKLRVVAYVRVSSSQQVREGMGMETQEKALKSWARENGHRLVAVLKDNGISGALPETERPGLLEALNMISTEQADALVVTQLDRLARALHVQEGALGQVWRLGGRVFTLAGEVLKDDPDDPMRTAMRQMAGVFAELDRRMIVQRMRRGRNAGAAKGLRSRGGMSPYGYRSEKGKLVPVPEEQAVIERIKQLRAEGFGSRRIAEKLNAEGLRPRRAGISRSGGAKGTHNRGEPGPGIWHPTMVMRVLRAAGVSLV